MPLPLNLNRDDVVALWDQLYAEEARLEVKLRGDARCSRGMHLEAGVQESFVEVEDQTFSPFMFGP